MQRTVTRWKQELLVLEGLREVDRLEDHANNKQCNEIFAAMSRRGSSSAVRQQFVSMYAWKGTAAQFGKKTDLHGTRKSLVVSH